MLPKLFIEFHARCGRNGSDVAALQVTCADYHIPFRREEGEGYSSYVIGHPIIDGVICAKRMLAEMRSGLGADVLKDLNGEYLLIRHCKKTNALTIANDRFTSIPLYYWHDGEKLVGSVFYNDLWLWLKEHGKLQVSESAIFEFLWFQRVHGTKTYDEQSRYLPASTCMTYRDGGVSNDRYWAPQYEKTGAPLGECAATLAELLKQSVRRKTSDGKRRYGHFLSGGIDSRTILGCFETPPTCFTISVGKNNEYDVAREAAETVGAQHVHIPLNADPYTRHMDKMVKLGGGMHVFDHALFYGYEEIVSKYADVVFHGHGVDYMFQGMYVPTEFRRLFGRNTHIKKLRGIEDDVAADYISNISYRLKGTDLLQYIKGSHKKALSDKLYRGIQQIVQEGRQYCNTPHDLWEYLQIHAISRHYPYTNLLSMGTCAEQRTVTFDNDVFSYYLSLPLEYRYDGRIARQTLSVISKRLAAIRTANTNMSVAWPPWRQFISRSTDYALASLGVRRERKYAPPAEERTWPHRTRMIRSQPDIRKAALEICQSEPLSALGMLDMDKLRRDIPQWVDNPPHDCIGDFLSHLITVDRFLKQ